MGRQRGSQENRAEELLAVGPFGGIDPTTETYYVSQTNFVDMMNIVPNVGYGGYVTAPGRIVFPIIPGLLPGHILSISKFSTQTVEYGYIVIVDSSPNVRLFYCATGVQQELMLPAGAMFRSTYVVDNITLDTSFSTVTYGRWLFITNGVDKPIKVDTDFLVSYWGITGPTTVPTATATGPGVLTGQFIYTVTFAAPYQESGQGQLPSGLGANSNTVTAVNQQIQLANVPVSSDPQVTKRNIYRMGGGTGTWNYIGTINDNTTTTFTDNVPVGSVGQTLVVIRDAPLPFKYIAEHDNCIFGFGTQDNASLVYYSNFDEPWGFNLAIQSLPVGDNSFTDVAVGLGQAGNVLGLVKNSSLYGVYGNSATSFDVQHIADIGGLSPDAVLSAYGALWYMSRQGSYIWDGSSEPKNISDGGFQKSNIKRILDTMPDVDKVQCVTWAFDQMIGHSFPSLNVSYIYDMRSQAWYPISWATDVPCVDENGRYPLIGQNLEAPGQIDQWFAGGGDLGQEITAFILSGITNSGTPQSQKYYRYVLVECQPQAADLGVEIIADTGLHQAVENFRVDVGARGPVQQFDCKPSIVGKTVQLKVSIITDQIVHIQRASVHGWEINRYISATSPTNP